MGTIPPPPSAVPLPLHKGGLGLWLNKQGGNGMKKRWVLILTALGAAALMALMCFAGDIRISSYPYPTYLLQAKAWLDGMVHLPKNYEFLELAVVGIEIR